MARGAATGRVVVGVSGSLASLAALRRGVEEARRMEAPLVAVLAWEPPEGEGVHRHRPEPSWVRMWADEARQRLSRAFEEATGGLPLDVRVERRTVRGNPAAVLCAAASDAGDLLVLGTARPSPAAARLHPRPVHRMVLSNADCAVLAVPGPRLMPGEAGILRRTGAKGNPAR